MGFPPKRPVRVPSIIRNGFPLSFVVLQLQFAAVAARLLSTSIVAFVFRFSILLSVPLFLLSARPFCEGANFIAPERRPGPDRLSENQFSSAYRFAKCGNLRGLNACDVAIKENSCL